jgi:transposase-like protein
MKSRQDISAGIKSSFPGYERLIDLAIRDDSSFRELCEDYQMCANALRRWQRLNGEETSSRCEEYSELLTELAEEIETWLDETENDSPRVSRIET